MNLRLFKCSNGGLFLKPIEKNNLALKFSTSTTDKAPTQSSNSILRNAKLKLFEIMSVYEEAIGLKEVKIAQQNVLEVKTLKISLKKTL